MALIGCDLEKRAIYLPTEKLASIPWSFERHSPVSQLAINMQRSFARSKGIRTFVGILHSHPPDDLKIAGIVVRKGRLSAGDIHNILADSTDGTMIGVADGSINSLAFRARESIVPTMSHEEFYDVWEREPQPKNLDILLAEKYKFALFKGKPNDLLKRIYPFKR